MKNTEIYNINYIKAKIIDIYISKIAYNVYKKRQTKLRPQLKEETMKMMQDQAEMQEHIKINVFEGIKANFFSLNQTKVAVIGIFVVSTLTYLVYYNFSSKNPQPQQKESIIANQEKIKVSPTFINKPTNTPNFTEIVDADIIKNKNNNAKKDKQSIAKSNSNLVEKLVTNGSNNKNNISIEEASSDTRSEDRSANLVGLQKIYISNLIETELREELEKVVKSSGKFTVVDQVMADATLQWSFSQPDTIILSTTSIPILWKALVNKSMSFQEQAERVVFSLVQTIDTEKEKLEKNKQ